MVPLKCREVRAWSVWGVCWLLSGILGLIANPLQNRLWKVGLYGIAAAILLVVLVMMMYSVYTSAVQEDEKYENRCARAKQKAIEVIILPFLLCALMGVLNTAVPVSAEQQSVMYSTICSMLVCIIGVYHCAKVYFYKRREKEESSETD